MKIPRLKTKNLNLKIILSASSVSSVVRSVVRFPRKDRLPDKAAGQGRWGSRQTRLEHTPVGIFVKITRLDKTEGRVWLTATVKSLRGQPANLTCKRQLPIFTPVKIRENPCNPWLNIFFSSNVPNFILRGETLFLQTNPISIRVLGVFGG